MQNAAKIDVSVQDNDKVKQDYEKVKLLFDYTKFHIGIYTGLGGILIAALGLHDNITLKFYGGVLWISIGFIAIAGLAGESSPAHFPNPIH
jgi:hypothetical protein